MRPEARKCGVYRIRNIVTNQSYYGGSVNIVSRFANHRGGLREGTCKCKALQESWNLYGEKQHVFEIVLLCSKSELRMNEQRYLDLPCLNTSKRASGVVTTREHIVYKHEQEARERLSSNPPDLSQVEKLTADMHANARMGGKKLSPEAREKIRQASIRQHAEGRAFKIPPRNFKVA